MRLLARLMRKEAKKRKGGGSDIKLQIKTCQVRDVLQMFWSRSSGGGLEMVARVSTLAFEGVECRPVDVQIQISGGTVAFTIVGLGDKDIGDTYFISLILDRRAERFKWNNSKMKYVSPLCPPFLRRR